MEKQKCPEVRFKGFTLEWEEFKLENMFTFYRGESFSKSDIVKDGNFKCIHYGELFTKYNSVIDEVLSSTNLKGLNFGRIGDILMPSSDVTPDGLAKASCLKVDNVLLGGDINILRPVSLISSVFISYQINHSKEKILKCVTGTTVKHVYNKDLKELGYLITTFKEQTQIGNFFQNLDQSIALQEKKLSQTQNLKKAMLEKMFPKAGSTQPEIRLKGFSGDWALQPLENIFGKIRNAFVGTATPYYVKSGRFYLESNNVKDGKINRKSEIFINDYFYYKQQDKWLKTNDIVMVQSGHVGHAAVITEELNNSAAHALIMFTDYKVDADPHFINYQIQTDNAKNEIDKITTGNTIKHILSSDMKKFSLLFPCVKEQEKIGHFFKQLDETLALQHQQLQTLKNLKQAFLEKMFV
ncbi:restriction endonuclease subunit S [uncultured Acinetobacter sp.]|uniref:restriction endonuclease subunit S n=1 Tax=uncultured Acinetobacter sp. TaxID=165433 RepID=UPI00260CC32B|nr:restriction endonuclease subunit S [uncultured Acinetobacter sp.]